MRTARLQDLKSGFVSDLSGIRSDVPLDIREMVMRGSLQTSGTIF